MISNAITVVSGIPRSGTSMMMQLLHAGGMPVLSDSTRKPDADNPKGYFELEAVKHMAQDQSFLAQATGRAVKIVSELLKYLPTGYTYKILFMERHMGEILASQKKMLVRHGQGADPIPDEKMAVLFEKHLLRTKEWLKEQRHMEALYLHYNEILSSPREHISRIIEFLGCALCAEEMVRVVDAGLHRQQLK
jgi:hypothetical protein